MISRSDSRLVASYYHIWALTRVANFVADAVLDRAATVLRMLYVNDLRHLQTHINELIATMQVRHTSVNTALLVLTRCI